MFIYWDCKILSGTATFHKRGVLDCNFQNPGEIPGCEGVFVTLTCFHDVDFGYTFTCRLYYLGSKQQSAYTDKLTSLYNLCLSCLLIAGLLVTWLI